MRAELEVSLLQRMLAHEPADRPPTAAILKHPVFWSKVQLYVYSSSTVTNLFGEAQDKGPPSVVGI